GTGTIVGGTISGNHASGNGGGVNVNNAVKVQDTIITGNTAGGSGGGLLQWNAGQAVAITGATFSGNVALQGGGAWVMGDTLVTGAAFQANHISAGGTGLLAGAGLCLGCASSPAAGPLTIANSIFISNTLDSNGTGLAAGAGLYTNGASTVITGTQIIGNLSTSNNAAASTRGAGIYALNGPLSVIDSKIQGNRANGAVGAMMTTAGGIEADHLPLVSVRGSTFAGNQGWFGGGLSCNYVTKCVVQDTQFDGNQAGYGAGIDASSVEVRRSSFTNNTVVNEGAAVSAGGALTLDRTRITNNKAGISAVWASGALTLTNVLIADTAFTGSPAYAGDLKIGNAVWSNRSLKHVTIAAATLRSVAGILLDTNVITAPLRIENTIVANHAIGVNAAAGLVLENYNLYGLNTTNISGLHAGDVGMVYSDPRFVNPGKGDYHLQPGSPAINAGANLGITVDLDGNPRPALGGYDIGAYELMAHLWLPMLMR
ncbi:MAG TPA: choice-of-anchor Q domain-containing protein, partial [Anaerolineae bacterium]